MGSGSMHESGAYHNEIMGRKGTFRPDPYDDVILDDEGALHKKIAYVLSNAVRSGLVDESSEWPGFSTAPISESGEGFTITGVNRTRYSRGTQHRKNKPSRDSFAETYRFSLAVPPTLDGLCPERRSAELRELISTADRFHREMRGGKRCLGVKRVLSQNPTSRPRAADDAFKQRKRFDCSSGERRAELKARYADFIYQYKKVFTHYAETTVPKKRFHNDWPPGSYPPSHCRPVAV
jgi:hypothetical protein